MICKPGLLMLSSHSVGILFLMLTILAFESSVSAQENSNGSSTANVNAKAANQNTSNAEQQLTNAQTKYYNAQTEKINDDRSRWSQIVSFGAFIAAMVAIISVILNYSSVLRTQRDTHFYEALKRFGDKDSATTRSSAAGLLARMGQLKGYLFRWRKPYFEIALDQLMAGLMLEENSVCLASIIYAIRQLTIYDSIRVLEKISDSNLKLQKDMVEALARFLATKDTDESQAFYIDAYWNEAAASTPYEENVLHTLADRYSQDFTRLFRRAGHEYLITDATKKADYLIAAQQALSITSNRLKLNVDIYSQVLKTNPFQKIQLQLSKYITFMGTLIIPAMNFKDVFLANVELPYTNLQGMNFESGQLQGAYLRKANLSKASLSRANLQGANLSYAILQEANLSLAKLQSFELKLEDGSVYRTVAADLSGATLQKADLSCADLRGLNLRATDFKEADLSAANLGLMTIDDETNLKNTEWWKADFSHRKAFLEEEEIDTALLEELYKRFSPKVPIKIDEAHPSARSFIEAKRQADSSKGK